ncbi:MAG: hypothetical protein HKN51_05370 [Saprospiraceae bacterium]|nr:DUF6090 family protein [Flaviramulus sp.]NNC50522.1 hypothetical protein [Flaviramulus sp.]NNE14383.1 hypothetical protein [Saprospiraceae bacterium]
MIKFFRKIRQKMLTENKFSKYLLYAIGEIILVVIGILIALQINNWNENRKQQIKLQQIYHEILADLKRERDYANFIINKFEGQRKAYSDYLESFSNTKITRKSMYRKLLELNMEGYPINSNSSIVESLQNSGEIVLLPQSIRNRLINLRRQQNKIIVDEGLDNRGRMGVMERLTMLIGSLSLDERLKNQKELRSELKIEENINQIILGLEAGQEWMDFSESKSIRLLKEFVNEINAVEKLIIEETK